MMAPKANSVVPMLQPLFSHEFEPVNGLITLGDATGFRIDLKPAHG